MVGFEVEILETGLRGSEDMGFDGEVARMSNCPLASLTWGGRWYCKSSKREDKLEEGMEQIHIEVFVGPDESQKEMAGLKAYWQSCITIFIFLVTCMTNMDSCTS